jgi:CheY-like chemotaxis protein
MSKPLRVLMVEDDPKDAEMILLLLRRGGYEPDMERVETAAALESALNSASWDIAISDYNLPLFSALEALSILRRKAPDLPCIVMSGTIGEETAIDLLKQGACDFVAKDKPSRLAPAIERELREAEGRRKHQENEDALIRNEYRLSRLSTCLIDLNSNYQTNVDRITALCGDTLDGAFAFYNRLENGFLRSVGQWQTPPDYNAKDRPDGHICYDVIRNATDETVVINHLPATPYAKTDPNVIRYGFQTYIGRAVCCRDRAVGSLCVIYGKDTHPTDDDMMFLNIAASALSREENRKWAEDEVRSKGEEWEQTFASVSDLVSIHDLDFRIVRVNKAFARMFHADPETLVGRFCFEVIHKTREPFCFCPMRETLVSKETTVREIFEPGLVCCSLNEWS